MKYACTMPDCTATARVGSTSCADCEDGAHDAAVGIVPRASLTPVAIYQVKSHWLLRRHRARIDGGVFKAFSPRGAYRKALRAARKNRP
jgi:hypothetical protein